MMSHNACESSSADEEEEQFVAPKGVEVDMYSPSEMPESLDTIVAMAEETKNHRENVENYEASKLKHFPLLMLRKKITVKRKQEPSKLEQSMHQDKKDMELLRGCFEIDNLAASYESIEGLSVLLKRNIGLGDLPAESDIAALKDIVRNCTACIAISLRGTDLHKSTLVSSYFQRVSQT